MKRAFTMLELVLVIVILAIVASIGSEIFAKTYDNYVKTRSVQNLQIQSQIAIEQIAKRLSYRIDYTLGAYEGDVKLIENTSNKGNVDLIWHERDYEANRLKYTQTPAYSGYANCDVAKPRVCVSSGSELANYDGKGFIMFNTDWYQADDETFKEAFYNNKQPICMGKADCDVKFENGKITITNGNHNSFDTYSTYQISTKIYRLTAENEKIGVDSNKLYDLYLYSCDVGDFDSCKTGAKNAKKYLLARNVSDFRFRTLTSSNSGGTYGIMLKLCVADPIFTYDNKGVAHDFAVCKTQVVE